ncbi:unnamed protein product [Ranitomeya imitator]|uniref:Uncharacterized protein n=1 Tax=Ranitomeya imitator TaxID=111125 RepID=A0ABN9LGD7_9NEOB|nr:unnamed protein product [Ranitomeya imitator]
MIKARKPVSMRSYHRTWRIFFACFIVFRLTPYRHRTYYTVRCRLPCFDAGLRDSYSMDVVYLESAYMLMFVFQTTPMLHKDFDRSIVKTLHKPFFLTEVSKLEKNMAVADHTKLAQSAKVKQNGTSHSSIIPAHFTLLQKPSRNTEVESWKLSRSFNAAAGKTNHTIGFAFEKSFPIKNAASLSSWSGGTLRRSPKKVQRPQITTVEEVIEGRKWPWGLRFPTPYLRDKLASIGLIVAIGAEFEDHGD